jgi:hypothetical protein
MAQHTIIGCQYVCALNPDVGSGQLNPRMQRHFTALAVDFPVPTSLVTIYETFLDGAYFPLISLPDKAYLPNWDSAFEKSVFTV